MFGDWTVIDFIYAVALWAACIGCFILCYYLVKWLDIYLLYRDRHTFWGRFDPVEPDTIWINDDDNMRFDSDFTYIDPFYKKWTSPKGCITNGASIPRFFWRVAGAPLNGSYRRAAAIHDTQCDMKTAPWKEVHLTFWRAMRCCRTPPILAFVLWLAVRCFGPRW